MNRLPSVTTVLSVLNKEGLSWGAAKETAIYAANHQDEWRHLDTPAAVDKLRRWHRGLWDHRAAMGTALHTVNETWARGEEVDLEHLVKEMQASNRIWQNKPTGDLTAEAGLMVEGLAAAWMKLNPLTISVEDVVRYPGGDLGYIGQTDWRCLIGGKKWLVDLKTTAQTDPTKGLYFDSWRLQAAGYRYCTERVHYDAPRVHRPYAKGIKETGTSPLSPVDDTAILHIRADGRWEFIPIQAGEAEHRLFLMLREAWGWLKTESNRAKVAA